MLALPLSEGLELIIEAIRNDSNEKLYMRWLSGYQNVSFEEFKKSLTKNEDNRSAEEIDDYLTALFRNKGDKNG